jgi:two-component system sensor histidine kinase RegB
MQQGAGTVGEGLTACTVTQLLDETFVGIREAPRVVRELPEDVASYGLRVPPHAVSQALRSLVTNAQDASPATAAVLLSVRRQGDLLTIIIRDRGKGIAPEVMARIGEPFFTTKAPGRGMGLGLYLARAVIEGVGGQLELVPGEGGGTEVRVVLPTDVAGPEPAGQIVARAPRRESPGPRVVSKSA